MKIKEKSTPAGTFNFKLLSERMLQKRMKEEQTQRAAAKEIGISQSGFYKMELGLQMASFVNVLKVANWLECPVTDFVTNVTVNKLTIKNK